MQDSEHVTLVRPDLVWMVHFGQFTELPLDRRVVGCDTHTKALVRTRTQALYQHITMLFQQLIAAVLQFWNWSSRSMSIGTMVR